MIYDKKLPEKQGEKADYSVFVLGIMRFFIFFSLRKKGKSRSSRSAHKTAYAYCHSHGFRHYDRAKYRDDKRHTIFFSHYDMHRS